MSACKLEIAVEPLSRASWERVESKLFASLDRDEHLAPAPGEYIARRGFGMRLGVMATTLAAAAAMLLFLRDHPAWHQQPLVGRELALSGATVSPPAASAPMFLADGSSIETTTAPVQSTIGDSLLEIAEQSSLRVSGSDAQGWLVKLEAGRVDCRVAPRHGRAPFAVQAGETRVTVVGTRFSVERRHDGARVVVQEGIVRVQSGERSVLLSPGQSWSDDAILGSSARPAPPDPRVPEPRPATRPASSLHSRRTAGDEQRRFERAARLESIDPQAALRIYLELDRHDAWSANALYARGRLELALGRRRGKQGLQLYLRRYPKGPNAEDVRALLRESEARGAARAALPSR